MPGAGPGTALPDLGRGAPAVAGRFTAATAERPPAGRSDVVAHLQPLAHPADPAVVLRGVG